MMSVLRRELTIKKFIFQKRKEYISNILQGTRKKEKKFEVNRKKQKVKIRAEVNETKTDNP